MPTVEKYFCNIKTACRRMDQQQHNQMQNIKAIASTIRAMYGLKWVVPMHARNEFVSGKGLTIQLWKQVSFLRVSLQQESLFMSRAGNCKRWCHEMYTEYVTFLLALIMIRVRLQVVVVAMPYRWVILALQQAMLSPESSATVPYLLDEFEDDVLSFWVRSSLDSFVASFSSSSIFFSFDS